MAFGDRWVSGSLEGVMRAPLHVLVVLLCSVYRVFSCNLHFLGSHPYPPFLYSLISYLLCRFSTVLPVWCDGCWGGGGGGGQGSWLGCM